jgi:hypothetical protein
VINVQEVILDTDVLDAVIDASVGRARDKWVEYNGYVCTRMPDSHEWKAEAPGRKIIHASSLDQLRRFINNVKPVEHFGNAKC